ncbi:MAG: RDD family protein, partial [Flavobacterium sp.]|nr:RDD family protein [Flavobacterium sp.]
MSQLSIITTQNVVINFTAASVGERILAFLTDIVIQIAYAIMVFYGIFNLLQFGDLIRNWDNWSRIAVIILFFIPIIFYTILLESIFEGQTFGKRLLKIKVVKIDGYQASFGDYLIRWLFRLIDIFSNSGILALISIVITDKSQRLGDISAGTSVISLKNNISINSTILQEIDEQYIPTYASVIKLSDNDVRIIL